jgi:tetratricopeptide (TPR) repeat protein
MEPLPGPLVPPKNSINRFFLAGLQSPAVEHLAPLLALALAVLALYGSFLSSPLVFDDFSYFGAPITDVLGADLHFGLRWLSVSTFVWVRAVFGADLIWQRLGNLTLHIVNTWLLYLFLLKLFQATLLAEKTDDGGGASGWPLTLSWLAFLAAGWFALNPAAVYGVAYLVQRTTLLATLFALSTWYLFLQGLLRNQRRWLLASAASYLLAVLSKEHAIMVPTVALMLWLLVRPPGQRPFKELAPTLVCYLAVAVYTLVQVKSGGIVGSAYEPSGQGMLAELNIDAGQAYGLSLLTQSFLFFKYLVLWLVPVPAWMSVDMQEHFVRSFWSWPQTVAAAIFLLYPVLALRWLLQRGSKGLLGFAMLGPWLLFATELSTVRIQEVFVLYRSYLWMSCLAVGVALLLRQLAARHALVVFALATLALVPASWNRLTTFSDSRLLWDDALQLAQGKEETNQLGRMHHNRGVAYLNAGRYQEAIRDFDAGLKILPYYSLLFNDRAVAYLKAGQYPQALQDFNRAILLDPGYYNPYLGRAQVHQALGNAQAARLDFARSCQMGVTEVCRLGQ